MKILAADLWPIVGLDEQFGAAADSERIRSQMRLQQLVENILLYDQVILPTDNLLSVRILADTFGPEGLALLIDQGIIRFVRFKGMLAYVGEGRGLTTMSLASTGDSGKPVAPMWLPVGVAAYSILRDAPGIVDRRARQIAVKIAAATTEIELEHFRNDIRDKTRAVALSPLLDDTLKIQSADLENLPGKAVNEVTVPENFRQPLATNNDIGRLLRIARTQQEIIAQRKMNCEDLSTLSPIGKVISTEQAGTLRHLYEITDAPDVGTTVMSGGIRLEQVIELRNSRHWQEFAKWFHEACGSEPAKVGREYVKLLKQPNGLDSGFFKTVRLLVPTVVGFVNPAVGIALSAADMFLTPKLKEPSAKYFVEELEQMTAKQITN